jgi:predicted Zn-dependent peptidase
VIGKDPSHIENATLEDIRRFFFAHYAPDNAILSIAGNVDYDTTLRLVEKWFGGIPSRNVAVRDSVASGTMPGQGQTLTVHGRVPQTMIVAAWRMAAYNEPDYIPCDIITDLLASGNSSRMRRNLILGTDLFVEADASISGLEGHGYLMLTAKPSAEDSKTVAAATAALISEARKLCDPAAITGHELQRAANRYEAMYAMRQMGYAEQALTAAIAEYHGEDPAQATVRYRNAAKAEAIAAAARCTLSSEPAVLLYRPH